VLHRRLRRIKKSGTRLLSPQQWKTRLVFWCGAILLGLVAVGFAMASEQANELYKHIIAYSPYLPLLISPAVLIVVAWLTVRVFPGSEGSGIPQAIAALEMRDDKQRGRLLSVRIVIGKVILTLLGLLSGASIGREGPTVHVGASIMYSLGRLARFPLHYLDRGLILAGGAAGIAAAFNTPLAGVVFAIEEMSRSFEERTSGTLLTAVVIAGVTAVALQGNYAYFGSTPASLKLGGAWLAVLVCGVAGGLLGGLFSSMLIHGSRWLAPLRKRRPLLIAAVCGLLIAAIGLLSGGATYGTGYDQARQVVTGTGEVAHSFAYLKLAATVVSYLSGIPGGIFAPSLATGAGMGAHMAPLFPSVSPTAVVILTMAAYFAGVVQTPITASIIVMEMTNNQTMILPIMATAFIAFLVSRLVCPEAIYRVLAESFLGSPEIKPTPEPKEDQAPPSPEATPAPAVEQHNPDRMP
jgi:H+/Cl- antiporter ClcA